MKPSLKVDTRLHKVQSASSAVSVPTSFHSAFSHTGKIEEKDDGTSEQDGQKCKSRTDSGIGGFTIAQTDPPFRMSTADIGFFEVSASPDTAVDRQEGSKLARSAERTSLSTVAFQSDFAIPKFKRPSNPPSPRSSTSRKRTTTPQSSRPPSGRSISERTQQADLTRRPTPFRSSSGAYNRDYRVCPYVVHRRGKELFGSLEGTLAMVHPASSEHREPPLRLSVSALPNLSKCSTLEVHGPAPGHEILEKEGSIANYTPATIIDWTSLSTRRREYDEIDRSCQGIRGLWRRLSPRWCRRNSRMSFYTGDDDSDAGSVRRYRMDIPKTLDLKDCSNPDVKVREKEARPLLNRGKTSWACFVTKGRKGELRTW